MEEGKAEVQHEAMSGPIDGKDKDSSEEADLQEVENENDNSISSTQTETMETTTTTTTSTGKPFKPMKFTLDNLTAMRTKCNNLIKTLDDYYYGKDQAIAMLQNPYIGQWDFTTVELDHVESTDYAKLFDNDDETNTVSPEKLRATKLVNTMLRALVTDEQEVFLMGGIGSSVMAGHDNW